MIYSSFLIQLNTIEAIFRPFLMRTEEAYYVKKWTVTLFEPCIYIYIYIYVHIYKHNTVWLHCLKKKSHKAGLATQCNKSADVKSTTGSLVSHMTTPGSECKSNMAASLINMFLRLWSVKHESVMQGAVRVENWKLSRRYSSDTRWIEENSPHLLW